ncbi:uncharacterized protein LOC131244011 [Magnolia sinica]|uniref:uncharacterized protein LOC131244011 n=1 Tax=Magnolia sinica TaxID=86752 RepID=UPI002658782E|nr:uncharacterized protein LOC131244011 [Magnolia sinica]
MTWAGEDWGPIGTDQDRSINGHYESVQKMGEKEEDRLLGEKKGASSTEVKIKITKKELEELLGKLDIQGMSIEKVLTQLMDAGGECHLRHRSWRPALQSIPEVN